MLQEKQQINMSSENQIKAWAASEQKGKLSEWSYTPRPIGPRDVEIDITHCGICGTDVQFIDNGFGYTMYPLVPGHEFVGNVTRVGSEVSRVKIGQRVGVGPQVQSCHECDNCSDHQENYCLKRVFTYAGVYSDGQRAFGGYAQSVRVDERFTFVIPENLKSEEVAPLLCIGITAYAPFKHNNVGPGKRVGVIGIGGVGHIALKFARALGAEVYAISTSASKEEEAKKLGAHHFINTNDKESLAKYQNHLDFILCTVNNENIDWNAFFSLLRREGTFHLIGGLSNPIPFNTGAFMFKNAKFGGSFIGSPDETDEMLAFASKHNVAANVQVWPIEKVNEAIEDFRKGKPRYRYVLQLKQ
jgi:D-arabinose 1-dehydrogenase-like Zn-dependent alcohol dehydrogenase